MIGVGLAGAVFAVLAGSQTGPGVVEIQDTAVVYEGEAPGRLAITFDQPVIERLIPQLPTGAVTHLQCRGYTREGELTGCTLAVEPDGRGYEAAAEAFVSSVRLDGAIMNLDRGDNVESLWITLRMWNWAQRPTIPCRPPGCSVTHVPPPPPVISGRD